MKKRQKSKKNQLFIENILEPAQLRSTLLQKPTQKPPDSGSTRKTVALVQKTSLTAPQYAAGSNALLAKTISSNHRSTQWHEHGKTVHGARLAPFAGD
jgi:hypothetical protein